jgi:hypothetical protein
MPAVMTGVLPEQLEAVWPHVATLLAEVCTRSRGKESLVELRAALGGGIKQLWTWWEPDGKGTVRALAVTDVAVYPGTRICRISICVGAGRRAWLSDGLAAIEAWAREQGCDAVEPFCRPGWKRELQALGYRERHVLMRKELPGSLPGGSVAGFCTEASQVPSGEALEGA